MSEITIRWIAMEVGTDIHVPLRMNSNNFGDPLTFQAPSSGIITLIYPFIWFMTKYLLN